METIRMTVICTTVMLVRCQKLARMSDLVPIDLSHAEFGPEPKKRAKATLKRDESTWKHRLVIVSICDSFAFI